MNGPVQMYKTRQIIKHDLKVDLPTCMYGMRNIHAKTNDLGPLGDHVSPFQDSADISKQVKQLLKRIEDLSEMDTLIDRQERILRQLNDLRQEMLNLKTNLCSTTVTNELVKNAVSTPTEVPKLLNIVINVSPQHPPYSLLLIKKLCVDLFNVNVSTHLHSTVSSLPEKTLTFEKQLQSFPVNANLPTYTIRLIWKTVVPSCELIVSQVPISGEPNVLRYLARLIPNVLIYETADNVWEIDSALDLSYSLIRARTKTERLGLIQSLNKKLGKSKFLCGHSEMTIADLAASSAIRQVADNEVTQNMMKWLQRCDE
ncbi:hypothetical protein RN001_012871 [Aquatica leii]|uniref:Aminoacyl tRNA synthase complex-interacting multifunctional protein 2 n=1 Tax=Aquatica leii TaxID=1421715 RepID=A0AAN7SFF6_9COLE|nr:hypothetical protein RN001_012871 [Aquatica leii]